MIGVRFLWNFVVTVLIRALDRRPSQRARRGELAQPGRRRWAGMRGAVSLAAALALPLHTDAGAPLPGRDLILFITFALILVTLVGQGLTLPLADPPPRRRSRTAPRRSARRSARGW